MKLTIPMRDGTTLLFEGTYDELVPLAEKMVEKCGSMIALDGAELQRDSAPGASTSRRWSEQSVRRLWGLLYGDQAKLVKFLAQHGGKATYEEVQKHMGYGAQHLSGILSPITRNAQTATGDRLARLVDWRIRDGGTREYFLDPIALALLEQINKHP
jgi:hypothetical protein